MPKKTNKTLISCKSPAYKEDLKLETILDIKDLLIQIEKLLKKKG